MSHTHRKGDKSEYAKDLRQEREKIQKWERKLIELSDYISEIAENEIKELGFSEW